MNQHPNEKISLQTLKILWLGLLVSQLSFLAALYYVLQTKEPLDVGEEFVYGFAVAALVIFALSFFVPKFVLKATKAEFLRQRGLQDSKQVSDDDLLKNFFAPFVLRMALLEAVTLMGFGLAYTTGKFEHFLLFFAVGVTFHFTFFPSLQKVKDSFLKA